MIRKLSKVVKQQQLIIEDLENKNQNKPILIDVDTITTNDIDNDIIKKDEHNRIIDKFNNELNKVSIIINQKNEEYEKIQNENIKLQRILTRSQGVIKAQQELIDKMESSRKNRGKISHVQINRRLQVPLDLGANEMEEEQFHDYIDTTNDDEEDIYEDVNESYISESDQESFNNENNNGHFARPPLPLSPKKVNNVFNSNSNNDNNDDEIQNDNDDDTILQEEIHDKENISFFENEMANTDNEMSKQNDKLPNNDNTPAAYHNIYFDNKDNHAIEDDYEYNDPSLLLSNIKPTMNQSYTSNTRHEDDDHDDYNDNPKDISDEVQYEMNSYEDDMKTSQNSTTDIQDFKSFIERDSMQRSYDESINSSRQSEDICNDTNDASIISHGNTVSTENHKHDNNDLSFVSCIDKEYISKEDKLTANDHPYPSQQSSIEFDLRVSSSSSVSHGIWKNVTNVEDSFALIQNYYMRDSLVISEMSNEDFDRDNDDDDNNNSNNNK